jgi:PBP1b-binding outer membrane lipoprotein LpoB
MKILVAIAALLLSGCAVMSNPDVEKSLSRDKTMEHMARAALINDMLNSPDPHIRAKGAAIAEKFLTEPKRNIFGF